MSQAAVAMPRLADARARLDAKDAAGAEKLLSAILAETPDEGAALHLMGIALVRLGRVAEAAQMLERGAAGKANRVEDLPYRIEQLLGSKKLTQMASAAKALGRPNAAKAVCGEVLKRLEAKA